MLLAYVQETNMIFYDIFNYFFISLAVAKKLAIRILNRLEAKEATEAKAR